MNRPVIIIILACLIAAVAWLAFHHSSRSKLKEERFRDLVMSKLREQFPSSNFQPVPANPSCILVGGFQLGLDNLRRQYEVSDKSDKTLTELVRAHFTSFAQGTRNTLSFPKSFEEARPRLLPQIMPPAVAADESSVTIPFGGGLFVGIVADDDRAYMYLTKDTVKKWEMSEAQIYEIALKNLDSRSSGMKLQAFKKGDTSFIAVGAGDGYDAARILIPGLKKVLGEKLGFPFNFGIPNRDFLICWSTPEGEDSRKFVNARLKEDFEHQPYPLSSSVFQVTADGTIAEQAKTHPTRQRGE